jgi:hypothetical protein
MIFARSPYYVTQSGSANDDTSVELYIWNDPASAPLTPTYTLSKRIPSSIITSCSYNISPYLREYIAYSSFTSAATNSSPPKAGIEYCFVTIKKYKNGVLQSTTSNVEVLDGYGYYSQDYNPDLGSILATPSTYYYWYDANNDLASTQLNRAGEVCVKTGTSWTAVYTDLVTAGTSTINLTNDSLVRPTAVYKSGGTNYYPNGNKLEIKNGSSVVQATFYFKPIEECKYTPVVIDFVNKYGHWQRTFMFKASRENVEVNNTEYYLMQDIDYDTSNGQFQVFNANGKEYISCNTGWVDEDYNENTLKQLLLSEKVLVNAKPAKIRTKSIAFNKHINDKLINYSIEFDYSNYVINNV